VANYGIDAEIRSTDNGPLGQYGPFNAERNVVLGVMSWGYEDPGLPGAKQIVGSSMFGTNREFPADTYGIRGPGNIGALMDAGEWSGTQGKVHVWIPYHLQLVLLFMHAPCLARHTHSLLPFRFNYPQEISNKVPEMHP
jgi:hypothetical protein